MVDRNAMSFLCAISENTNTNKFVRKMGMTGRKRRGDIRKENQSSETGSGVISNKSPWSKYGLYLICRSFSLRTVPLFFSVKGGR